jgi:hypothetical protein
MSGELMMKRTVLVVILAGVFVFIQSSEIFLGVGISDISGKHLNREILTGGRLLGLPDNEFFYLGMDSELKDDDGNSIPLANCIGESADIDEGSYYTVKGEVMQVDVCACQKKYLNKSRDWESIEGASDIYLEVSDCLRPQKRFDTFYSRYGSYTLEYRCRPDSQMKLLYLNCTETPEKRGWPGALI